MNINFTKSLKLNGYLYLVKRATTIKFSTVRNILKEGSIKKQYCLKILKQIEKKNIYYAHYDKKYAGSSI